MLIVHGVYHFWPKRVAFRNDYCLTCHRARRSVAIRTFDVVHLFWVPVLPLGAWKHWKCANCGRDPHLNPKTRRLFKWAGLVVMIIFSAAFWIVPLDPPDQWISWLFRLGGPIGAVLLFVHLLRSPKDTSLRQELQAIAPANDTICPFCDTPLLAGPRWLCPSCGSVRH
jgi:hypothetical protein